MNIHKVCVIGGSGFVGRHVVHMLAAQGYAVRVVTRRRERAKGLIVLPKVEVVEADVNDRAQLKRQLEQVDAVINLVGILYEGRKGQDFNYVHVDLPLKLMQACEENGVKRYIHISALAADVSAPSAYLRTKGFAEKLIADKGKSSVCRYTVFRPSVVFGRDDRFFNLFAALVKYLPVVFLGSPSARFQPIFVEDVARAVVASLTKPETFGQSYDLCGPQTFTLRQLVEFVCSTTGRTRMIVSLNDSLSYWQAWWMEWLPVKLLTRDNYYSMKVDNVCNCEFPKIFGFSPTPMETIVPQYLTGLTPRMRGRQRLDQSGR